jgi:hypothetical protein
MDAASASRPDLPGPLWRVSRMPRVGVGVSVSVGVAIPGTVDRDDVSEVTLAMELFLTCLRKCASGCDGQGSGSVGVIMGEDDGVEAGDAGSTAVVVSRVTRRRIDEIC